MSQSASANEVLAFISAYPQCDPAKLPFFCCSATAGLMFYRGRQQIDDPPHSTFLMLGIRMATELSPMARFHHEFITESGGSVRISMSATRHSSQRRSCRRQPASGRRAISLGSTTFDGSTTTAVVLSGPLTEVNGGHGAL
jgi:hypothetical protein